MQLPFSVNQVPENVIIYTELRSYPPPILKHPTGGSDLQINPTV